MRLARTEPSSTEEACDKTRLTPHSRQSIRRSFLHFPPAQSGSSFPDSRPHGPLLIVSVELRYF